MAGCSIDGCCKTHEAKGFCKAHYRRLLRHGDPLGGGTPYGETIRFIHEVAIKHESDDCLIWPYGKDSKGYGAVKIDGKNIGSHRYVCTLVNGEPPTPEHEAAHSCGNGHLGCVNPNHLEWKTPAENCADRLVHGTHSRGERHGNAKLTEEQAREVIRLKGVRTPREIASLFGVAETTIRDIHAGRNWGWLTTYTFRLLSSFRWEVVRGDGFIMAVFGTRREASAYCLRKNAEAAR